MHLFVHRRDTSASCPRLGLRAALNVVRRQTYVFLAVAAVTLWPSAGMAQEMAVPVELQLTVLSRVLSYDRRLTSRAERTLVMGVIYQPQVRLSVRTKDEVMAWALRNADAISKQFDLQCVPIALTDTTDLRMAIKRNRVDVLYVAPLRAVNVEHITGVTRQEEVLTITGVVSYVHSGIALGVGQVASRTRVLVNLPASKDEGSDFTAQLLAVSQVIDGQRE
ncbi:MAG: YfiR family protein [Gemmatimonadota bacterium]|nr:YfiR family protein [Gemmatimonadota bacterium]